MILVTLRLTFFVRLCFSNLFSKTFRSFSKTFGLLGPFETFPEIGRAETIHLVRKSSNFELSSRFFGRLKIFIGQGSLYSLEPIFQTRHYAYTCVNITISD